jgi:ppGpp synthetase/RelA/SpoT-type nucleotidyltranferase
MKIPQSVRVLYEDLKPKYESLKEAVDRLMVMKKEPRWHYESRVKEDESFALKLETGRVKNPSAPEDFFGCTLVVENHSRIAAAEEMVSALFELDSRRPKNAKQTHLQPSSFEFDDLRLFVKWKDERTLPATGFHGVVFEIQIRTFLQHAWGIATHDFVYKSDDVDWPASRIAYQVKAMLENAELSIGAAQKLSDSAMIDRTNDQFGELKHLIQEIRSRWEPERLPKDLRRLAEIICDLSYILNIKLDDIWGAVDEASSKGAGAKTLDLSPYSATIAALISQRGANLFEPLEHYRNKRSIFVPTEIDLPDISAAAARFIIRASALS